MNKQTTLIELHDLANIIKQTPKFSEETYRANNVMRGLRDQNGTGVITGLTDISDVIAKKEIDGVRQPAPGELYYRSIDVKKIIEGYNDENRSGLEETAYLLLLEIFLTNNNLMNLRNCL